jgi:hypothetical protein
MKIVGVAGLDACGVPFTQVNAGESGADESDSPPEEGDDGHT